MAVFHAFAIDGQGNARAIDTPDGSLRDGDLRDGEWRWVHLDRAQPTADAVLTQLRIDADEREDLLSEETRPRLTAVEDGTIVILRAVNLNPGAAAHETLALRMFVRDDLVVSLRRDRIFAVADMRARYETGRGPASPLALVAALCEGLTRRIAETVDALEDRLDAIEVDALTLVDQRLRERLGDVRRSVVPLRRYVLPQRDVVAGLADADLAGQTPELRDDIVQQAEETQRLVEVLETLRERAALIGEEIAAELADRLNRNTYALSIIAAIFLPLGFLTGLLGINVGGMPGTQSEHAFWIVVALCVAAAAFVVWLLRRARLM